MQCRYTPCLNPRCIFKHAEGQRTGNSWNKDHVSDRKFNSADGEQEELIIPGQNDQEAQPSAEVTMEQAEDVVA